MELQTKVKLKIQEKAIDYNSKLLLIGSCFSENIGEKFNYYKFQNIINPFGILFHPKAIENLIVNAVSGRKYNEDALLFLNEQWHCYEAHSKLSHSNKTVILDQLNNSITSTSKQIKEASHIILTLGTAWVYRLSENDTIVANCHKVPQKAFRKELLPIAVIIESLKTIINTVSKVNAKAVILFTVSPIRHIKDGFIENTRSKAHLISAIHQVISNFSSIANINELSYFPSYEIMMDELRDYRFYKQDMLHPNNTAVNYIWERFKSSWIRKSAFTTMDEVDDIQKGLQHIPNQANSIAHLKFTEKLNLRQEKLQEKFEHMSF